ncbi:isopenicillin N synthase family oxygenase [Bradyrhizobium sp. KBS0727]|uniref:isopenicillin N synthase family dioxygenase n=1 Tax=unclassified Bradyrhizobium TaxID=2631580 RepID=UPI00110EB7AD|nr:MULTISPECIES: 2-oxoglutarate and iron-dependent oxygenase domain-containing protein [unclassified Bradyrhizobium]QDW40057.1 isopenicillin N synthase family oxygenase [Bradyrhizobium sp. KBS0725]QDW46660.1 isopenicillin N synthase family oxygenase [Bradyrhizobium sp. KBS0727]
MSAIPVIDIAPLVDGSPAQARAVARDLGNACRDVGFFYIANHGVPSALMKRVFETSAAFFAGPASIREAVSFSGPGGNRGYIRVGGETLDPGKPADVKEAFNIGLELPPDDPEMLARAPFRAANLWPHMPGFRDTMLDYFNRVWRLGRDLHRGFALDLGLEPDYFETRLDRPNATLRLLHYPQSAVPLSEGQLGAGVHTDYGNVTLLATDEVGGLMVQDRSGRWLDAPVIPDTFVCNIGDCLMRWSNDVYVSTPHKVVNPGKDRYSVAFFLDPNPDAVVACLPTCVSADRPAKYPPITGAEFLRSRLEPTYAAKQARG